MIDVFINGIIRVVSARARLPLWKIALDHLYVEQKDPEDGHDDEDGHKDPDAPARTLRQGRHAAAGFFFVILRLVLEHVRQPASLLRRLNYVAQFFGK